MFYCAEEVSPGASSPLSSGHFLHVGTFRPSHMNTPSFSYSRNIPSCTFKHSVIFLHMHVSLYVPSHVPVLVLLMFRCMLSHLPEHVASSGACSGSCSNTCCSLIMCDYVLFHVLVHVASICRIYIPGVCSAAFVFHVRLHVPPHFPSYVLVFVLYMFCCIVGCVLQCLLCCEPRCMFWFISRRACSIICSIMFFFTYSMACSFAWSVACPVVNIQWYFHGMFLCIFTVMFRRMSRRACSMAFHGIFVAYSIAHLKHETCLNHNRLSGPNYFLLFVNEQKHRLSS
jgi:hypothetical protein